MLAAGASTNLLFDYRYALIFYNNATTGRYQGHGLLIRAADINGHWINPGELALRFTNIEGGLRVENLLSETATFNFRIFRLAD